MKKTFLSVVSLLLCTALFAQMPEHSPKLEKEEGFNILKVGALLSKVKTVLKPDTIDRKTSFEPKAQTVKWTDRIYLVDLKKPGYSQFCGKNIARIEVWFMSYYDEAKKIDDFEIKEVKIFFKAVSETDTDAFFNKLMHVYGNAIGGPDMPEPGMDQYTWDSSLVLMTGTSFYGDPVSEEIKKDYIKIEFESAVGG